MLVTNLARLGISSVEMNGISGGSIVAANASARVLRLTTESGYDFLWMNKGIESLKEDDLYTDEGWLNLGGDRIWIAPECEIHVSDTSRWSETHRVPTEMDPGDYAIARTESGVEMRSEFALYNHRLKCEFGLSVSRIVEPSANPLKDLRSDSDLLDAEYVGYHQKSEISLKSSPLAGLKVGIWHLAQVPAVGEIIVPVTVTKSPKVYFGPEGSDGLKVGTSLVRLSVDASRYFKIGVKAGYSYGRSAFARQDSNGAWTLLVRNFGVDPSAEYVDYPADDQEDRGYAIQCFMDDGSLGSFGEVEHHAPGIGSGLGKASQIDECDTWGFRGEKKTIERIGETLLGRAISL